MATIKSSAAAFNN
jgi:Phage tail fibre repeat